EGVRVVVADIDEAAAENTTSAIKGAGNEALTMGWDIGDLSSIEGRLASIEKAFGSVDILVNNTGGPPSGNHAGRGGPAHAGAGGRIRQAAAGTRGPRGAAD
ncbi:SDR family NAD(P)-dependent oxidoreductase, partial [Mesorhizobium sp.]|uniref:SDR family NAD(P)-dependent oxidoreductase n=1 Tax=Mesorhizobium sp. TaxID=1871066 RepID=UPI0025F8EA4A